MSCSFNSPHLPSSGCPPDGLGLSLLSFSSDCPTHPHTPVPVPHRHHQLSFHSHSPTCISFLLSVLPTSVDLLYSESDRYGLLLCNSCLGSLASLLVLFYYCFDLLTGLFDLCMLRTWILAAPYRIPLPVWNCFSGFLVCLPHIPVCPFA